MNNRRQNPRFVFNEAVGYQRGGGLPLEGSLADDISQTGLRLSVHEFIPLNTVLELKIQLPGQFQLIPFSAKVVWVKEIPFRDDAWEVGLSLVTSESFSSAIRDYVSINRLESLS